MKNQIAKIMKTVSVVEDSIIFSFLQEKLVKNREVNIK